MTAFTLDYGCVARARARVNAHVAAFAERATDIDADGTLFIRVLCVLLCVTVVRLAVNASSGVPTFEEGSVTTLARGLVCFALSFVAARYRLAEAALVLRAGAALGLSGVAFSTTCVDIFHLGRAWPLADHTFARMDAWLGLDWIGYARLVDSHETLWNAAVLAYASLIPQFAAALVILAFSRSARRLYTYLLAQTIALSAVAAVAAFLPAIGAFEEHHGAAAAFAHRFLTGDNMTASILWLRSDLSAPGGVDVFTLISFPSFHACSAVLFVYAWWKVPYARWIAVCLNTAMLAATPVHGSHYFVDVIAGVAIAPIAIAVARSLVLTLASPFHKRVASYPMPLSGRDRGDDRLVRNWLLDVTAGAARQSPQRAPAE